MKRPFWFEPIAATIVVTLLVTAASLWLPERHVTSAVGAIFLGAVWLLVWRLDDTAVRSAGLSLGGLMTHEPVSIRRMSVESVRALVIAAVVGAVVFIPYFFAWRAWWGPDVPFALRAPSTGWLQELFGQIVIVAFPEEAFYRGYLQSCLNDASPNSWPKAMRAAVAIVIASALFAVGHIATVHAPERLAVFFPALLFGLVRNRTGGIGAACFLHAMCNLLSETLGRGYGLY